MDAIKALGGVHINWIGEVCFIMDDVPVCTALKIDDLKNRIQKYFVPKNIKEDYKKEPQL